MQAEADVKWAAPGKGEPTERSKKDRGKRRKGRSARMRNSTQALGRPRWGWKEKAPEPHGTVQT